MLNDKDRIFTNLYGDVSPHYDSALQRGDWDNTKVCILKGADWIID